jgi:5'-methylthioadenosine phosphorylase
MEAGVELGPGVVYVCVDGPRYETPAEVRMFAKWGGDVVGMTSGAEVILCGELDMCYAALAMVTNYAAGFSKHRLQHREVVASAKQLQPTVRRILERAVALIPEAGNGRFMD